MLGALLRAFGQDNFALLEEAIQTAFQRALETWPVSGAPQNPAGWLYHIARNTALDVSAKTKSPSKNFEQKKTHANHFRSRALSRSFAKKKSTRKLRPRIFAFRIIL